jgi:dTDP-4-dehydrorhamnose 3,5-epimerase-like enzyme
MPAFPEPHIIEFPRLGKSDIGFISVADSAQKLVPFSIERVFWTYHTPESIVRGRHAHRETQQVMICLTGRILVTLEDAHGKVETFMLDQPEKALYIPPHLWHTMQYSHTAIQLVFASTAYSENDYLRDYESFKQYWKNKP